MAPNPFSAVHDEMDIGLKKSYVSGIQTPTMVDLCTVKKLCSSPCRCPKITQGHPPNQEQLHTKTTFSSHHKGKDMLDGCEVNKQLERLQVPSYPLPPSVLDYQPNFFTIVKSRPLQEGFKRTEAIKTQQSVFFSALMTGYVQDDVRRRQEQHKLDTWELQKISEELDVVKKTFKKFIESSNEESVALVRDQLHAGHQREEVEATLVTHKGMLTTIKTDIFKLESHLSTLLLCRGLMLQLSPTTWREEYEHKAREYSVKKTWMNDLLNLYSDYCRYYPGPKDFFMDEAMELLLKEVETIGPPEIYFTESWQIAMLLRRKELDCLSQLSDVVHLERKIAEIYKLYKDSTKYRAAKMAAISEQMDKGQAEFEYQRKRAVDLEATANALIPRYVDILFSGDIMLETTALIEVLYLEIFGHGRQMPDSLQMMVQIERAIRLLHQEWANINPDVVKYFEKKIEAEESKKYKEAMGAKRAYREAKCVVNAARAMWERPPRVRRTWKIPARRSQVPLRTKKTRKSSKRDNDFQHLQLNGILINDNLEENVDRAIAAFVGKQFRLSSLTGDIADQCEYNSSILSCASTESLEKAAYDQPDFEIQKSDASDADQKDELVVIEMGYDSDEELIKQNYDKKKGLQGKPPVLYDVKTIDDRFMVESDVKLTKKDRRHTNREPRQAQKNNALSWR